MKFMYVCTDRVQEQLTAVAPKIVSKLFSECEVGDRTILVLEAIVSSLFAINSFKVKQDSFSAHALVSLTTSITKSLFQ